jgi:PhnB protein
MLFGEMSLNSNFMTTEENKNKYYYKNHKYNETKITLSDIPPKSPCAKGDKITLVIFSDDLEEIKVLYYKLKDGGKVEIPLQETAWSKAYASLIDQYGVEWQLNYENDIIT